MRFRDAIRSCSPTAFGEFAVIAAIAMALALGLTPHFNQAVVVHLIRSVAQGHNLDPDDFVRMAKIESGFDPTAYHPRSKASGLFQFIPSTARQYKLKRVFDARANADAAAALWRDNAATLRRALRRKPSPGEIYLAHQQGAGGAIRLLTNPERPATEIVGHDAVTMNGGSAKMSARAFASMWIDRFHRQ